MEGYAMNNLEFALEMKNKRLASGLSQGELASLTHVSRYSINRFENGKANASKETQNIILRCLNYYICDKLFYSDNPHRHFCIFQIKREYPADRTYL